MDSNLEQAITVIKQGGIVVFPTDTAFGIGCRVDSEKTIERLFAIRKRPITQAMSVLVNSKEMAKQYVDTISAEVEERLIDRFWPGAVTIILSSHTKGVPDLVRGGGETLGVRMPNHQTTLALITGAGVGILGPSANFHGQKTPYAYEELDPLLLEQVDFVVPGTCAIKQASTVIDCTQKPWKIIREGAVHI